MAEAFLSFSEVPETGPDRGIETLDQIHLTLSRPTNRSMIRSQTTAFRFSITDSFLDFVGTEVVQALRQRKGDNQATEFLSKLSSKVERKP